MADRLRLIVVVVGHIVFHGVVREESLELAVQLGGQRLVVAQYQRWLVDVGNDVGYGECLSGSGDTEQCLCGKSLAHALGQLCDGLRLVTGGW